MARFSDSNETVTGGVVAHGAADEGFPLKVGGKASTAVPSAVSNGDRVNAYFDEYGRLIVKGVTPTFSASDSITRPANTTAYAANKSINCSLTVTAVAYTLKVVTLTSAAHPLVAGARITVAGMNTGATLTNVDGNWVIDSVATNTITFTVTSQPTGTTPQTGLTITGAIAKCMSMDVGVVSGGGIILSGLSLALPGVAMTGAVRCYIYVRQPTVLADQVTFTLLVANDTYRRAVYDLYPQTEGSGSDGTFISIDKWRVIKCDSGDTAGGGTRLYFRLAAEAAGTPASAGVATLRAAGIPCLG